MTVADISDHTDKTVHAAVVELNGFVWDNELEDDCYFVKLGRPEGEHMSADNNFVLVKVKPGTSKETKQKLIDFAGNLPLLILPQAPKEHATYHQFGHTLSCMNSAVYTAIDASFRPDPKKTDVRLPLDVYQSSLRAPILIAG